MDRIMDAKGTGRESLGQQFRCLSRELVCSAGSVYRYDAVMKVEACHQFVISLLRKTSLLKDLEAPH